MAFDDDDDLDDTGQPASRTGGAPRGRKGSQRGGRPRNDRKRSDVFPEMRFGSSQEIRGTLERLARGYTVGSVTEGQLRILTYVLRAFLPYFEFERGDGLDKRLDLVEKALALGKYADRGV